MLIASDGTQDKKVRVVVLGRGTLSKSKLQSPPQADRYRKPTNADVKRLGRQIGAARRKCTRVGPNCRDRAIGSWNVSSVIGKEQELVWEAQQYRLDIVEISSTTRRSPRTVELNGAWVENFWLRCWCSNVCSSWCWLTCQFRHCWVCRWLGTTGRKGLSSTVKLRLQESSLRILQVYAPKMEPQLKAFLEKYREIPQYAKCHEKKHRGTVELKLADAQCGFRPGRRTMHGPDHCLAVNLWEVAGICERGQCMFCWSWKSIWSHS